MITDRSQRWRERRARYVPNSEVVDPRRYAVDGIEPAAARRFIADHHYLPSYPASIYAAGLFQMGKGGRSQLAGVAVFAVPTIDKVVTRHSGLSSARQGCVLGRFVLLDEVPGNGESFMLARALRLLRAERPEIEAVVSYSDPLAGHIGACYAALSGSYRGQTSPRTGYVVGGRAISGRTLSKIRLGERGAGGAVDQLVAAGAPAPSANEALPTWLDRLNRERVLLRSRRPGLHTYCFELTRRARTLGRALPRRPYPKILTQPQPELALGDH